MENMKGRARDVQLNGKLSSDPATPFSLSYKALSLSLSISLPPLGVLFPLHLTGRVLRESAGLVLKQTG